MKRLETFSVELVHHVQNDKQWVSIEYTPLFDEAGNHTGYIAVHQNITTRKERQQKIHKQNQALQKIAWISSHDIRRPVASILGLIHLTGNIQSREEHDEILQMINHCAIELDDIVRNITKRVYDEVEVV